MSALTGPLYAKEAYAGFFRRALALALDLLILALLYVVVRALWFVLAPAGYYTDTALSYFDIAWTAVSVAYVIGFRFSLYGTPGYRILGIQYAYVIDARPTWSAIAFRSLAAAFLLWFFALDLFWILVDPRKQAWHDKISGFYVIKRSAKPIGTQPVILRVIDFMMLSFPVYEPAGESPAPSDT
jgi:uncharacterized RDD family membrane protein YckC